MKIWMVKTGEPIPYLSAEAGDRYMRAGQIVRHLHTAGHQVTWWASQFDHMAKRQRPDAANTVLHTKDGPGIILMQSPGYKKHMSIQRAVDHWRIAQTFRKLAANQPKPDIIICAYPTIDLAHAVTEFGLAHNIPTVVDVRDLWPDIFEERLIDKLPFMSPKLARLVFSPYRRKGTKALSQAVSVTSLTPSMLEWAQKTGGRTAQQRSRDFMNYQCKPMPVITPLQPDHDVRLYLEQRPLAPDGKPKIRLVWAGSIIHGTDAATLFKALKNQPAAVSDYLDFVICGRGPLGPDFAALAKEHDNITYFEWLESNELNIMLDQSHIGMMCYLDTPDFNVSIPNKVVDYFAASLRILTNLSGDIKRMAGEKDVLVSYKTGDSNSLLATFSDIAARADHFRAKPDAARALYDQHFNAANVLPAYEAHLVQLHKARSV